MAVVWRLQSFLVQSGLMTPMLVADVGVLFLILYLAKSSIAPAVNLFLKAKVLDQLVGTSPK